jgi:hypothetical protein
MVFTAFLEMVDDHFSPTITETIIDKAELASQGAYTAVGTYDHREIVRLVTELANVTGRRTPELMKAFGEDLFSRFVRAYPQFFTQSHDAFGFLAGIEHTIHREVRKLYPDAELPSFECSFPDAQTLCMVYRSRRSFADLAEGLIAGCISHFGKPISIAREDLACSDGALVRFTLHGAP